LGEKTFSKFRGEPTSPRGSSAAGRQPAPFLAAPAGLYLSGLLGWTLLHAAFGDRWWWLFGANAFADWLFLPVIAAIPLVMYARRRSLWVGLVLATMIFVTQFGADYLPKAVAEGPAERTLTVMNYNVLGTNRDPNAVVATIRAMQPDIVGLEELNLEGAAAIRRELAADYPYQILDAKRGVTGMGFISRYPARLVSETLPGEWTGKPMVISLDFHGTPVTVLTLHPLSTSPARPAAMEATITERAANARAIDDAKAAHPGPFIVLVDFNTTPRNDAYYAVTRTLADSWREAGWGPGHTFTVLSLPHKPLLVRIDYVFHSAEWQATSAWVAPWDGASDHRALVARLVLRSD
jgi:endonuclease/exonuclease/phosphatase (EEP) superfamily protein YafD